MNTAWSAKSIFWRAKTDEFLVEALRDGEPEDKELAIQVLHDRYASKLKGYIGFRLGNHWIDWVDDVSQETWSAFDVNVRLRGHEVKKNVRKYLWGIATNQIYRTMRELTNDQRFENALRPDNITTQDSNDLVEPDGRASDYRQFLLQLPYFAGITDCPRLVWTLRNLYQYPREVVARMMDKPLDTISAHSANVKQELERYRKSDNYNIDVAIREIIEEGSNQHFLVKQAGDLIVERSTELLTPQFTPEELSPLGMNVDEFREHYAVSLIMPGPATDCELIEQGRFYMLLTRRKEWIRMEEFFRRISLAESGFRFETSNKAFDELIRIRPEEFLIDVHVDDSNFILQPLYSFEPVYGIGTRYFGGELRVMSAGQATHPAHIYFSRHRQRLNKYLPLESIQNTPSGIHHSPTYKTMHLIEASMSQRTFPPFHSNEFLWELWHHADSQLEENMDTSSFITSLVREHSVFPPTPIPSNDPPLGSYVGDEYEPGLVHTIRVSESTIEIVSEYKHGTLSLEEQVWSKMANQEEDV